MCENNTAMHLRVSQNTARTKLHNILCIIYDILYQEHVVSVMKALF